MAQSSSIEWTQATWNPVAGCTPVSPGCLNCYAARMALRLATVGGRTARKYAGTASRARDGRPVFAGKITLDHDSLDLPRSWRLGRIIFVDRDRGDARRRSRNLVLGGVLVGLAVLFYAITIARMA